MRAAETSDKYVASFSTIAPLGAFLKPRSKRDIYLEEIREISLCARVSRRISTIIVMRFVPASDINFPANVSRSLRETTLKVSGSDLSRPNY